MRRRALPAFLALALARAALSGEPAPAPAATPPASAAETALAGLRRRYQETRSLRARFTQRLVSQAGSRALEEHGTVLVEKPGRMRWDYLEPEPKLFVLDGDSGWMYLPEDKVAYRIRLAADEMRRVPALLLAGRGDLARDFEVSLEPSTDGKVRLRLLPRGAGEAYRSVEIVADAITLELRSIVVEDPVGGRTELTLEAEETGVAVPEGSFRFTPPRGVEIVDSLPGER